MGCSSEYPDGYGQDFVPDVDRLLARIVLALQAESKLDRLSLDGFAEYAAAASASLEEECRRIPSSKEEILESVSSLVKAGWLYVEDGRVTITAIGILMCGVMLIPKAIADSFGKEVDVAILSRA